MGDDMTNEPALRVLEAVCKVASHSATDLSKRAHREWLRSLLLEVTDSITLGGGDPKGLADICHEVDQLLERGGIPGNLGSDTSETRIQYFDCPTTG
jgi:hypothetical protein